MLPRLALVLCLWSALYLPWLGTPEYYSEEGRRVMPAIEMLDTGNYLVPHIAGQLYFNKPPLMNWLIAASFSTFGRNEWSARLVSVSAVLLVALILLIAARDELGDRGSLLAAAAWLTNFGLIEKGRMAEIEALYSAIFALALICWLLLWRREASRWLTWIVPFVFLGLGLLAKGPAHLVFFYCIVVAILWSARRVRELVSLPHLCGILLMLAIFAAWAVPYFSAIHGADLSQEWSRELLSPVLGEQTTFRAWLLNLPRGLAYFLPWIMVLPFIRVRAVADARDRAIARGLFWGSLVPFVVILLLPDTFPRYVIPLAISLCWLVALACKTRAFVWRIPASVATAFISLVIIAEIILWPPRAAHALAKTPKLKARAAEVNQHVSPNDSIYVCRLSFQPYLLYVHASLRYIHSLDQLPPDATYLLVNVEDLPRFQQEQRWRALQPELLQTTASFRDLSTALFRLPH